jgi:hypothetical protein
MIKAFAIFLMILANPLWAQELNVDFSEHCKNQFENRFKEIDCNKIPPFELKKKDDQGKVWLIRFHFGFSRTDYEKTDLHINSQVMTTVVKDVEMVERTSAIHYDPRTWDSFQSYFQWIDEPTNTFTLSFEKGKNNFYITVFHPKYLKSILYKKSNLDGEEVYDFQDIEEKSDFSQTIPEGYSMLYLGNTHFNMNWQVGYGRQLTLFKSDKLGKLTYIPKADIGIATGKARSVNIIPGVAWDDYYDDLKIQGINASVGHRLEFKKGKVSMFVDHKTIFSKIKHGFYNGTIEYNLRATPITFGIGVDLFSPKKKKK